MGRVSAAILGLEGPILEAEEAMFFEIAQPFGFILFARNVETPDQLRRLTRDLRDCVGRDAPILIDQEGGRVQRMRAPHWRAWYPPFDQVQKAGPKRAARTLYLRNRIIAAELQEVGISVNCVPCADLSTPVTHPFLQNRTYGTTAEAVTPLARAVIDGCVDGGILPVLKHMPGHGRGAVDSHADLPRVSAQLEELLESDFKTFRALADVPLGMTGHVVFEALDPDRPATLSPEVIAFIRREIGFDGLLMTDDLSMNALPGSIAARAAGARQAGCDVILHCNGDRAEMEDVLSECGRLDGASARRAATALAAFAPPGPLDIAAWEAELSDLLDGAVYV